jgi:hypothetical protein
MKVLEAELIIELMNGTFACNSRWIPPRLNGNISKVNFLQGHGFLVIITKGFVLIMELKSNKLFGMFIKRLCAMEKTRPLFVNHLECRISSPINNANNIPICLHTICHEPFENKYTRPFLLNNCLQLPCPQIACYKPQSSWPYNRPSCKCDKPWSSILEHTLRDQTSSTHFADHHPVAFAKLDQI